MYTKKAGTVILAVSIVLWAMMTFPSLPENRQKVFDQRLDKATKAFLADSAVKRHFRSEKDLERFEKFLASPGETDREASKAKNPFFVALAETLKADGLEESSSGQEPDVQTAAGMYEELTEKRRVIENLRKTVELKNTLGGRIGVALEYVFSPMGYDWRTNIALIGGFAAKEVVVATLGTAYSLGEVDPDEADRLAEKLSREPGWNALKALSLILFVMLYAPCFVTLVVMKKETAGWRWPLFAMVYTTLLAYVVALAISGLGKALGVRV